MKAAVAFLTVGIFVAGCSLAGPAAAQSKKVLIVTGIDYPGHKWKLTTPILAKAISADKRLSVTITEDPNDLAKDTLGDYDVIVLHFMNWKVPDPGPKARANLQRAVRSGKGLVLVHFACGAFQQWPEFVKLVGRVWDPKLRPHDPYGKFTVEITDPQHPVMRGMKDFETTDELYTCLTGKTPIKVLATARSKVDHKDYPMAFVLNYGKGRVFQCVLGHDVQALANPNVGRLFRNACAWASGLEPLGKRAGNRTGLPKTVPSRKGRERMKLGFHTDAFNSAYFSFEKCLDWAKKNDVHYIECGLIDGVSWIHGLGYQPHVALYEDPLLLRRRMDGYGVRFSQVDAAYPLSGKDGPLRGVPYVMKAIQWAHLTGCSCVDTTDGMHRPQGLSDAEAMDMMKRSYEQIMEVAEIHKITVNIEPHGYFTTKPEMMEKMLVFCASTYLRMNMDTGNTFIAGQDPVAFLERFIDKIGHVHVKDVSESLAAATRGKQTGIAVSHCALGQGVNAGNIRKCLEILRDHGYNGVLSMECEGQGGPMIEQSLQWMRDMLAELKIPIDGYQ